MESNFDSLQCTTCIHIFCGMSEHYWIDLKQPIQDPCPNYHKQTYRSMDLDEYRDKWPKHESVELGDGRGQDFETFCPTHCPCGYPCTEMIGDDFKAKHPAMPKVRI